MPVDAPKTRCPECGSENIRSTAPTRDGRHHICRACNHMWRESRTDVRRSASAAGGSRAPHPPLLSPWTFEQAFAQFRRAFPLGFQDRA